MIDVKLGAEAMEYSGCGATTLASFRIDGQQEEGGSLSFARREGHASTPKVRSRVGYSITTRVLALGTDRLEALSEWIGFGGESQAQAVQAVISRRTYTIEVDELPGYGKLGRPIAIDLSDVDGSSIAECRELEAVESGADRIDAVLNLLEFIAGDFAFWLQADDGELTPQAKRLKDRYVSLRP